MGETATITGDPVCGMALEPKGVPAEGERPNPVPVDFTRRF